MGEPAPPPLSVFGGGKGEREITLWLDKGMSEDSILVSCLGLPRAQSLPRLEHKESRPALSHPQTV